MDTVVLAAGRGERLSEVTAPGHKPLIIINGKPIVQQAVDYGLQLGNTVVVVVSPENASPISHVLGNRHVRMIVQRKADGPGQALFLGALLCRDERIMVLMGDNISTWDDVKRVADQDYAVGVQSVSAEESERFTIYDHSLERWVEKVSPAEPAMMNDDKMYTAWVGPLVVSRKETLDLYSDGIDGATDIGPYIDAIAPCAVAVHVSTYDIGVPEMLQ